MSIKRHHPKPATPPPLPIRQPSIVHVRDSWLEPQNANLLRSSLSDNHPTMRPPAITLPDDELIADEDSFTEQEPQTLPRLRRAFGSLDEAALIAELSSAQLRESEGSSKLHLKSHPPRRSTSSPPAQTPAELDLSMLAVFEDLPDDTRRMFLDSGRECRFGRSSILTRFDTVLVTQGAVRVAPVRDGGPPVRFGPADLITVRTSVPVGSPPIIMGAERHTVAVVWQKAAVGRTVTLCPWFEDALREEGDRLQSLLLLASTLQSGMWRETETLARLTRLQVRLLPPHARLYERGSPVHSLAMVGIGDVELVEDGRVVSVLTTGELVFAPQVLSRASAPMMARSSAKGATVLLADTQVVKAALAALPLLARQLTGTS